MAQSSQTQNSQLRLRALELALQRVNEESPEDAVQRAETFLAFLTAGGSEPR